MWEGKPWWVDAGASEHELEDVRQQITELLNPPTSAAGPDAEDGEVTDGTVATAAAARASGPAAEAAKSAASVGQPQNGAVDGLALLEPVIGAIPPGLDPLHPGINPQYSPDEPRSDAGISPLPAHLAAMSPAGLQHLAVNPQFSPDVAEPAETMSPQMSPDENRSDASDTTGAGQRSPNARPGFSPVVEGRAVGSSLAGSKRRSPAAADMDDAQPAKRADTGLKAEQPAAGSSTVAAAQSAAAGPKPEQVSAANATGVSLEAAPDMDRAALGQQPEVAAALDAAAAGDSPPNRPAVWPAQPGLATATKRLSVSPLHPDVAVVTGAAVHGSAVADLSQMAGSTDVAAATAAADAGADDTIMSQDSAEPGEIVM